MSSIRDFLINEMKKYDIRKRSIEEIRQEYIATAKNLELPHGTTVDRVFIESLPAEWVKAVNVPDDQEQVILYFHGGGFFSGSCENHRNFASIISEACGVRVLLVEYRLAPEHNYPAANDDCLAAYRWLIKSGISAKDIVIGGDSAGASLTLMTLLSLRDAGEALPAAAFMISLWGDLVNFDGGSYKNRAELDFMCSLEGNQISSDYYFGSLTVKPPILSPIRQNLEGLPNLLVQVGDHEILLSDSTRLAERAKEAGVDVTGVDVTLEIWDNMWHIFQFFAPFVPEGNQAIKNISKFVKNNFR